MVGMDSLLNKLKGASTDVKKNSVRMMLASLTSEQRQQYYDNFKAKWKDHPQFEQMRKDFLEFTGLEGDVKP